MYIRSDAESFRPSTELVFFELVTWSAFPNFRFLLLLVISRNLRRNARYFDSLWVNPGLMLWHLRKLFSIASSVAIFRLLLFARNGFAILACRVFVCYSTKSSFSAGIAASRRRGEVLLHHVSRIAAASAENTQFNMDRSMYFLLVAERRADVGLRTFCRRLARCRTIFCRVRWHSWIFRCISRTRIMYQM